MAVVLEEMVEEDTGLGVEETVILSPAEVKKKIVVDDVVGSVLENRNVIQGILDRIDERMIVITGPCSVHNYDSALEFAKYVKSLSEKFGDKMFFVMRAYVEKPRSVLGWKGFMNDVNLDASCDIGKSVVETRKLFYEIAKLGVPIATEFLGANEYKYVEDLVSWAAIGARTSESQPHAEIVSGLEIPVGFKNNTSGSIKSGVNAVVKSRQSHVYLSVNDNGNYVRKRSHGNRYTHLILRGGFEPNYDSESVKEAVDLMESVGIRANIVVDCSHGNSGKDELKQPEVFRDVLKQRLIGNDNIRGVMIESNFEQGSQKFKYGVSKINDLSPYISITDAGISREIHDELIREVYNKLVNN